MSEPLRVGVAGLGTVGGGTVKLLLANADLLAARCGRPIVVSAVAEREKSRDLGISLDGITWHDDAMTMASSNDVDVVVELIGGSAGIAKKLCEAALENGKHVVTANKALIAHHGGKLAGIAESKGVQLAYEAAVAGGIPIIKALREGMVANNYSRVYGIMNGTCNYILTAMRESGREFSDVLDEAQELGYAEADPSFDVDGIDTAHKLSILTAVAFGCELNFHAVHVEGIRHVSALDIHFATELGYRIKLLGVASRTENGVEQRVHPCMVPLDAPIAAVEDVFNAVVAHGDYVGTTMHVGRGAGEKPTASAVVSDIADIARGLSLPTFGLPVKRLEKLPTRPMGEHSGAYYVRFTVLDKPGVMADISAALRDNDVSMESVLQHGRAPYEPVPLVMTVHEARESAMVGALAAIESLDAVVEPPRMIRIEAF
ncbi:homoserine dehydrogenase [Magnetospira sp. QH-2]|uniref:homoserine dehydrogenase n=1 Tax=Magnetospira sp. (strain QH-2) TaxID=1288970 RepID=UPI0003E80F66|nr:homoserine dehydrogenase [Magnetospira sp. QH-2]CCQ73664.1 Homoserine dehydrogenase (HDH) [Magnetospira sp. QH-2]